MRDPEPTLELPSEDPQPGQVPQPATPQRSPRWRRPVVLVSAVVALVLIVAGVVWTVQRNSAQARDEAITAVATGYLQAVAGSDAATALDLLAEAPKSHELLTDEVLRASAAEAALTDIVVTAVEARDQAATASVTYKLGEHDVAVDLALVGDGRTNWKLATGLSELMVTQTAGLRVNGVSISQTVHPVFPGSYTVTPAVPTLTIEGAPTVIIPAPGTAPATLTVMPVLGEQGLADVRAAARAAYDACLASKSSAPPGCPWQIDTSGVTIADDAVTYQATNDPWADFTPTVDLATLTASGTAHYEFTATAHISAPDREGEVTAKVSQDTPVTIDLASDPLKVTWR